MPSIASQNHCHSVNSVFDQQQKPQMAKQLRIVSSPHSSGSFRSKSQRVAALSPSSRLSSSDRTALLCWCCIRRPNKAVPSPPPSEAPFGSPVMTMALAQNGRGDGKTTASTPVELCVLKLNGLTERQQKQQQRKKKTRASTFSVSSASRGIFPRLHRSLSSQQQHKLFRTNGAAHAPPPLDLRALDAADGTPNNTTDYLEVDRAEGGWMRDQNFWRRQQEFWHTQSQTQQRDTVADKGGENTVKWEEQQEKEREQDQHEQQQQHLDMETARTSRTEDILHYPSMDTLIDEILLSTDGEERKRSAEDDEYKQYFNSSLADQTRNESSDGCELEAVVPCSPSPTSSAAATSSSSSSCCSPTRNCPTVATSAFPPAIFFTAAATKDLFLPLQNDAYGCGTSTAAASGAVTARQSALAAVPVWPRPLGALPALTQSLFDVITVTYVWIASSLALIVQWFL